MTVPLGNGYMKRTSGDHCSKCDKQIKSAYHWRDLAWDYALCNKCARTAGKLGNAY